MNRSFSTRFATSTLCAAVLMSVGCKKTEGSEEADASVTATAASAPAAPASASASASAPPAEKAAADVCPENAKAPTFHFVDDVTFDWTETPSLEGAPKDKVYANVGGKTFELPEIEVWVEEKRKTFSLRTAGDTLVGPSLTFEGKPKVATFKDGFADNKGYFQVPKSGDVPVQCFKQTTSYNGKNARALKLTKYDGKKASGVFVTTWEESRGEKRKFWSAGTFKDARVRIFEK